jgi:hypothetical protein
VPRVSSQLRPADILGTIKVRSRIGRADYTVDPGLYALGTPNDRSPVLVTANYKLTFDTLRSALGNLDAWILVLDTAGINVWCAAGKGTFSTEEIVRRVQASGVERVVSHRRLIVPQLGAPGTAAHEVRRLSGFRVVFGPVRAEELPEFLRAGSKATPEMRRKTFPLGERMVLIPVELVEALKAAFVLSFVFFFASGLGGSGSYWSNVMSHGVFSVAALLAAVGAGAVLTPILLPWLPGRAFALKGLWTGLVAVACLWLVRGSLGAPGTGYLESAAWSLMVLALASYLAMNFTGASTYTSLSGVRKEMRVAVPLQIVAAAAGLALWIGSRITA